MGRPSRAHSPGVTRDKAEAMQKEGLRLVGSVVDRSRCSAHTRPDQDPFLGTPCPSANGRTTPGADRGASECTAACYHHGEQSGSVSKVEMAIFTPPVHRPSG